MDIDNSLGGFTVEECLQHKLVAVLENVSYENIFFLASACPNFFDTFDTSLVLDLHQAETHGKRTIWLRVAQVEPLKLDFYNTYAAYIYGLVFARNASMSATATG